jgi:hypothetical protein
MEATYAPTEMAGISLSAPDPSLSLEQTRKKTWGDTLGGKPRSGVCGGPHPAFGLRADGGQDRPGDHEPVVLDACQPPNLTRLQALKIQD